VEKQKRTGDTIQTPGDYQYKALTSGNAVQRFWHESKQRVITKLLPPQPTDFILDVGCGSGVIADYLGKSGAKVLGIDGNEDAIRFAQNTFTAPNVEYRQGLVDDLFKCDTPPDKIYCLEVIEHIYFEQGRTMLENFKNLLKPGGFIFLTTPNYHSLWPLIEWAMGKFSSAARMDEVQHVAHYNSNYLAKMIAEAGLELVSLSSMCFAAPWLSPVSHSVAIGLENLEMSIPLLPGAILVAVARKSV